MKRFAAVLLAVFVGGCASGGGPKPPGPTPSPSPTNALLLKASGKAFVDQKGQPVDLHGFNSCCTSEDPEPSPDWSLISTEYIDYLTPKYGPNVLVHMRLGPWTPQPDFPANLVANGGPYAMVNGKADLMQWNPKFWDRLEFLIAYGQKKGVRFEIDLIDGWACKQTENQMERISAGYHPWIQRNNVQNLDAFSNCGKVEIRANGDEVNQVYERWLRKIVDHTAKFDNVIYQDGNEVILIPGYTQAWTAGASNVIHDEEAQKGFVRHLFGTNAAVTSASLPQVDYVTVHQAAPMTAQDVGNTTKPARNSEYNPNPPLTGSQMGVLYCDAKAKGFYWDFWRHGMSLAEAQDAWRRMSASCEGVVSGCTDIPNEDAVKVDPKPPAAYTKEVNATLDALAPDGQIGQPMKAWLLVFAQKFREMNPALCANVQTDFHGLVDEVCVGTTAQCQGQHVFACKSATCPSDNPDCGCDSGTAVRSPNSARDTWRRP